MYTLSQYIKFYSENGLEWLFGCDSGEDSAHLLFTFANTQTSSYQQSYTEKIFFKW